jgi:hypothetical protein
MKNRYTIQEVVEDINLEGRFVVFAIRAIHINGKAKYVTTKFPCYTVAEAENLIASLKHQDNTCGV